MAVCTRTRTTIPGRAGSDPGRLRRRRAAGGRVEARAGWHELGGGAAQYRQLRQGHADDDDPARRRGLEGLSRRCDQDAHRHAAAAAGRRPLARISGAGRQAGGDVGSSCGMVAAHRGGKQLERSAEDDERVHREDSRVRVELHGAGLREGHRPGRHVRRISGRVQEQRGQRGYVLGHPRRASVPEIEDRARAEESDADPARRKPNCSRSRPEELGGSIHGGPTV